MQPPRMAIMASGNTNLVAGDVGSGVRGVKGLRSLIDFAQQGADDPRRLRTRACLELHWRSEEHTSELQSLMRISYAVFCLKKKKNHTTLIIETYTST